MVALALSSWNDPDIAQKNESNAAITVTQTEAFCKSLGYTFEHPTKNRKGTCQHENRVSHAVGE